MVDYDMDFFDRLFSKKRSFSSFSVKIGAMEVFIYDKSSKSPVPGMRDRGNLAACLPPYEIHIVGRLGRNGKVYLDSRALGHEMLHCVAKASKGKVQDKH